MATDNKYDRQIRLWGGYGQKLLAETNLVMLGAFPAGVEALKNLVLPGIGHITVVDDRKVEEHDLGNNFFVTKEDLGKPIAEAVCNNLLEMNPDTKGRGIVQSPRESALNKDFLKQFTFVISNELSDQVNAELSQNCRELQIPNILIQTNGFIGYARFDGIEYGVVETKDDGVKYDLRIIDPFPELEEYFNTFDLEKIKAEKDEKAWTHVPMNVILRKMSQEWLKSHQGQYPGTFPLKKEFQKMILEQKDYLSTVVVPENFQEAAANAMYSYPTNKTYYMESVKDLGENEKSQKANEHSSNFWILVRAANIFIEKFKNPPVSAQLPEMTSTTEFYIRLQQIFKRKFLVDQEALVQIVAEVTGGKQQIPDAEVSRFIENIYFLKDMDYQPYFEEYQKPEENYDFDTDCIKWHLILRGVSAFREAHNRYPGEKDVDELQQITEDIRTSQYPFIVALQKDLYVEMARYEGARIHNIAAIIGGVVSQEAVKIITNQFVATETSFLYSGIKGEAKVFKF